MADWLRHLAKCLLDNFKNLPKNYILQIVLSLLIIYHKLNFLDGFCYKNENKHLVAVLLHNLIVDESLFENSVKPLWNSFDNLPYLILTIVKGAISFTPPLPEWIFAIPLLHLLNKQCEPFEILHSIEWDHVGTLKHRYVNIALHLKYIIIMYVFRYQWGDDPNKELQKYVCKDSGIIFIVSCV